MQHQHKFNSINTCFSRILVQTNWHASETSLPLISLSPSKLKKKKNLQMTPKKITSKATTTSEAYTEPITQSNSKRIMHEQEQVSVLPEKCQEQLIKPFNGEIVIKENHLFENFALTSDLLERQSHLEVVSVMMASVTTKVAMAEMGRKLNLLMKAIKERDHEIVVLRSNKGS